MSHNPITAYEALSYALHLLKEGKASTEHSKRLPVDDGRRRAMVGGGNVIQALEGVLQEVRPGGFRCRLSIPEYVKSQGFVPFDSYPEFEVYDNEYALIYGPIRLQDLSGGLGLAVQASILQTLWETVVARAPRIDF